MKKRLYITLVSALLFAAAAGCDRPQPVNPDGPDIEQPGVNPGTNPDNPDNPGTNPDNPGTNPDNPDNPDNPGTNPDPEPPTVVVLNPGKQPSEPQKPTPSQPNAIHTAGYSEFYDSLYDWVDDYGNVDYVVSQGFGTSWPIITEDYHLRLYQGTSASKGGSYIRVRSQNGATLQRIVLGTATATKVAYYKNGRISTQTSAETHAAGERWTLDCSAEKCTEVCFICMGTSQTERWELDSLQVTYKGGFIEDDFVSTDVEFEYGPLVQIGLPYTEDFESDAFPTTEKNTYYKYGLTAGPENLQWTTWFGCFSIQGKVGPGKFPQLRVYQEDPDYDKSQFGHLIMSYYIKDLRKVSFDFYYTEFWNNATITYSEFGTQTQCNPQQIKLANYSDRQTWQKFQYVLDGGTPHDAKIIIEIDPSTGHPSKDHYDFIFDNFRFE